MAGRDRVFQLKMAPGGGQSRRGILECVHQELNDYQGHQVTAMCLHSGTLPQFACVCVYEPVSS